MTGDALRVLYPEMAAGGFSRVDGSIAFYGRVAALLAESGPQAAVLDFGAGRGAFLDDPVPFRRDTRLLRGRAGRVVGIDIDDTVLTNPSLDEAHVVHVGDRLPLEDASFNLVVSDFTFEHISDPAWAAAEIDRVLQPGGWVCALTPNRWGYIGLGARVVPNRFHVGMLRHLQPRKPAQDTFPTTYLLNTPAALRRWFLPTRYDHIVWTVDSEPAYAGRSLAAARLTKTLFSLTPPPLRSILFAFLRKRDQLAPADGWASGGGGSPDPGS